MSDWEDEEFNVSGVNSAPAPKFTDEEEDEALVPPPASVSKIVPPKAQQEADRRRQIEEEEMLTNKLKFAQLESLSPEERRRKEKEMAEEADNAIANDLFESGGSNLRSSSASSSNSVLSGVSGAKLKNKQDHVNFGITVANKLNGSTSLCISSFYMELTNRVKNDLNIDGLQEIVASLETILADKKKKEELSKPPPVAKKSSKQVKAEKKKHEDTFGGSFEDDEYESYAGIEEDYMF